MTQDSNHTIVNGLRAVLMGALMFVTGTNAMAQESSETPTGVVVHGNVYGGGNQAGVLVNTAVNMSTGQVDGNVYGGGNVGDVGTHVDQNPVSVGNYVWKDQDGNEIKASTAENKLTGFSKVTITGGTVGVENPAKPKEHGNVFGGGKGETTTFECEKGMVYQTNVVINTTGVVVKGNVYGGGEVSRVEGNTEVTIGIASGTDEPSIEGNVFAAGAGVETHGYSALVRGTSSVTVQGKATVLKNVYGGGEKASVGRYKVKTPANASDSDVPATLPYGMPAKLISGGKNTVVIQNSAVIGTNTDGTGHVYGAGQGLEPQDYDYQTQAQYGAIDGNNVDDYKEDEHKPKRMVSGNSWEYFSSKVAYLQFVETLALSAETDVTITGSANVNGSVFGGSESGFVYHDTDVKIQNGTISGSAFGGGRGHESFAEAGRVRGNTKIAVSGGAVHGNVYGGGNLGDVGTINKDDPEGKYNYKWKNSAANGNVHSEGNNNTTENNKITSTNTNTGICTVTISGGIIGVNANSTANHASGHVFGAGKGLEDTWWCEKAMAFATNVSISTGTIYGNVYGGGQVGRVEDDAKVTIGTAGTPASGTEGEEGYVAAVAASGPDIKGDVYGAGAGIETHGYSALVRGNASVTVQGIAQVGGSVYGGGEIASVGKFEVVGGLPTKPDTGGTCIVNIKDNATIGTSGTGHNVFGACKGVTPHYDENNYKSVYSMQLLTNAPEDATLWDHYNGDANSPFILRYYKTEQDYLDFLKTLALTSNPHVTIGGTWTPNETTGIITASGTPTSLTPTVYGSVYGGGQRGVTLGAVDVNMVCGTVEQDVYGGGALADTNLGNWDVNGYVVATALNEGESITDLYERSGAGTAENPYKYTKITDSGTTFSSGTYYRQEATWAHTEGSAFYTTSVDLTGGTIKGDAYGGGLGQKTGFDSATSDIAAVVWGDINVTLGSNGGASATAFEITRYSDEGYTDVIKSGRVFGCNNLLGSPQGDVTVTAWKTVSLNADGTPKVKPGKETNTYELAAVYGGGNLAPYGTAGKKAHVIIHGCGDTSIETVYGGGNAAAVPETDVDVYSCYEIGTLFGGGNGKDKYKNDSGWQTNPGANVNGNANTMIYGGTVHEAYGASNEKGTIFGDVVIDLGTNAPGEACTLDVAKLVGAGRNADVNGDMKIIMGCKPSETIPIIYGGADNANVNGDVELTITSGNFGKVIGGNNAGGVIKGHIILNIEETTCIPINIEHLYLCGYNAAYSQYGYYVKTEETEAENGNGTGASSETAILSNGKLQFMPRESADDPHLPVNTYSYSESGEATWTVYPITGDNKFEGYAPPVLNVISCTSIGEVFGGGYGTGATVYGNPTVNINMIPGAHASKIKRSGSSNAHDLGAIGSVYGGGDAAAVYGNTNVNIGTATEVPVYVFADNESGEYELQYENGAPKTHTENVEGAYITGNVYGGGKLADVTGNAFVNVCAEQVAVVENNEPTGEFTYNIVNFTGTDYQGVIIGGNVYGGGEGYAKMEEGTDGEAFLCAKAMIGVDGEGIEDKNGDGKADHPEGGTSVVIGNGTVGTLVGEVGSQTLKPGTGNVYGGGEVGRVEKNTKVTIGIGNGTGNSSATSTPVILGNVFGAGAGVNTHGYSALVRGTSTVLVEGDAKVKGSVYGGGEIASVGRYKVVGGLPQVLNNALAPTSGYCYVTIRGYAEIGPDDMEMTKSGGPSDAGHVFGAGQGVLPYDGYDDDDKPFHMNGQQVLTNGTWDGKSWEDQAINYPAYVATQPLDDDYAKFIKSLALATETLVTIEGNPFIKGSVYGGSENGYVQKDSRVVISGGQIGNGYVQMDDDGNYLATKYSVNRRYSDEEWAAGHLIKDGETNYAHSLPECASWPYGETITVPSGENTTTTKTIYAPYDKYAMITVGHEEEYEMAYDVAGNKSTNGGRRQGSDGHTFYGNVFGGGSGYYPYRPGRWFMDAGAVYGDTQVDITGGHILTSIYGGNEMTDVSGTCTVNFGGTATLGVPRTLKQIGAHPVTCYLFGAGKGDQRVFFNKNTNVRDVEVNITGGTIYGSVFGGGEDGHVMRDVKMTIGQQTTTGEGAQATTTVTGPTIGTWGTSYVDGNVFGGGRGFSGDAYTAGNVAGSVKMEIKGGSILGSIYGGGRLGSVGYGLYDELTDGNPTPGYGEMRDDDKMDDGTDGTSFFTKGRGHIDITISGGTIGNNREYIIPNATNMAAAGIPEEDRDISKWDDDNKYWDTWKEYHKIPKTEFDPTTGRLTHTKGGNVFAGGMGNFYKQDGSTYINDVNWWQLGCVKSTKLTITGGTIRSNVYGGGELGQVVEHHTTQNANYGTEITIQGSNTTIGTEVKDASNNTQYTFGSVFGGGYGSLLDEITVNNGTSDVTSKPKFIAGLVEEDTKIDMQNGEVKASIYGGGEMASVNGSTDVAVSNGTIGIGPTGSGNNIKYFGGAKMGNVYGGGSGHNNTVRSGRILKNTNVTISGGTIYHNVYGGGAYGTVGDFDYQTGSDTEGGPIKVQGINGLATTGTGVATVTITGGTIGYDGKENGMVFGSSRGDINRPGARDDHTAWVYDTHVTIGTAATPAQGTEGQEGYVAATPATGPAIKGSVYGSGENGHVFHDTEVTVNGGIIGISGSTDPGYTVVSNGTSYSGAAYSYRGNVYGAGCGTDKYYHDAIPAGHTYNDGEGDYYNPLAGIVYGTTTVTINDGHVVRNVYGAGAMGSVGKTTWTTTTTGEGEEATTTTTATTDGGSTTVNINGGIIGISGTVGDGNVFGAARGAKDIIQTDYINDLSRVSVTNVNVSGGLVKGNVYGGGELGDVGTIVKNTSDYNYTWQKTGGGANTPLNNGITENNTNTGICNVTITGGTIGSTTEGTGNVFGGGKGDANTWWCEKAMAFATNVNVREASGSTTKVYGTVYGGGEIGRVEDDSKVIIGTENGEDTPEIVGSVFGAGKGLATRGYSALVRGNSVLTVQGSAQVGGNVFGGGEEASLGRFYLDKGLPKSPASGGSSTVTIQDNASIGSSGTGNHVYGAGQGVAPNFDADNYKNFKSMQLYGNRPKDEKDLVGDYWDYYVDEDNLEDRRFVWVYYKTEPEYQAFLNTLAIASHPTVTIAENATVYGDVYGGGQRGITLGDVTVNITGGTVKQDVYGGGSLADTNKGNWDDDRYVAATVVAGASVAGLYTVTGNDTNGNPVYAPTSADATADGSTTYYRKGTWAEGKYTTTHETTYKTNVTLTGGEIDRNVYGGGLGQLAKAAVAEQPAQGTEGQEGYVPAVPAQAAVSAVEAKVYGDVLVTLNGVKGTETTGEGESTTTTNTYYDCEVKGTIFGCNNFNGSPQSGVTVHVYNTFMKANGTVTTKPTKNTNTYEVEGVYGGGNLAAYYPDDATARETAKTNVIIDGCDLTSIRSVYGGGNAASVPETEVVVNGTWEIGEVFAGGNGNTDVSYDGGETYKTNPGANVGYRNYSGWDEDGNIVNASDADTKEHREANYAYGQGKAHVTIYGGTVHKVYGGSNKRGNVRVEARTTLIEGDDCEFNVGEAYGGGNDAPMDGDAILEAGCIPGLDIAYGGAANADVNGDVILNITNGTYGRVFGGNDQGGVIRGTITVNIEETGCRPIVIGQLYGGGNLAAYSVDNIIRTREDINFDDPTADNYYKNYPKVNVKSFTSIGTIFGGGYGSPATLVGNPQVNVNVYQGKYCNTFKNKDNVIDDNAKVVGVHVKYPSDNDPQYETGYPVPSHAKGAIGAINDVFGGGNEAKVIGTPTVNIGTEAGEEVYAEVYVKTGESVEGYYTSSINAETGAVEYTATAATDVAVAGTTYYLKTVKAVDIRGNVFGGGNNAEVEGDTNVVIGKKKL